VSSNASARSARVVIIGAGMSGLCLAIRLRQAGFQNITLLEQSDEVGGTWYKNTYPNAGCDVPSFLYCYSFAPNYDWSMKYARQPEILEYFRHCADRFNVREKIRFNTTVLSADFDEASGSWSVHTDDGETIVADVLVSAVGQLNRPSLPNLRGLDEFRGQHWHSARWNHDFDVRDKTVAVIGNGASAVQFVPEIAKTAKQVILLQRSPNWIETQNNYRYPAWAKWAFRRIPFCASLHRLWIFLMCEWRIIAFREGGKINREYARLLRRKMKELIPPHQWPALIPEYAPGCKRILLSNDFLPTLAREHVQVIREPLERFDAAGIVTSASRHDVDAVIFATGFKANEFLQPMEIRGRDGQTLNAAWQGRPKAHLGMTMPGFPNLFLLYGPNTNLGHNSIIYMVENQVNYIVRCLKHLERSAASLMEISPAAMQRYDTEVQTRLQSTVWAGDCTNWYKSKDGTIPNNWWGSAMAFAKRAGRPDFSDFRFAQRAEELSA
jgi:cation diffusion facilitator CzcD-associated flavoprotein CzcO